MFRNSENVIVLSALWAYQGGKEALERDIKGHCCLSREKGGTWNCCFVHNLVFLSCRNSGTGAWSWELGTGVSAAEGMWILEAVLEAALPLLLGEWPCPEQGPGRSGWGVESVSRFLG